MKSQTPNLLNGRRSGIVAQMPFAWVGRAYSRPKQALACLLDRIDYGFSWAGIVSEVSTAWLFAGFSLDRLGYVRRPPRIVIASEARHAA
jgi:hypothetical protein